METLKHKKILSSRDLHGLAAQLCGYIIMVALTIASGCTGISPQPEPFADEDGTTNDIPKAGDDSGQNPVLEEDVEGVNGAPDDNQCSPIEDEDLLTPLSPFWFVRGEAGDVDPVCELLLVYTDLETGLVSGQIATPEDDGSFLLPFETTPGTSVEVFARCPGESSQTLLAVAFPLSNQGVAQPPQVDCAASKASVSFGDCAECSCIEGAVVCSDIDCFPAACEGNQLYATWQNEDCEICTCSGDTMACPTGESPCQQCVPE